jgi:copper chaperone CopZ
VINCSSSTKTISTDDSADYETRTYEVFGMDCPGCESGLSKLINEIEAVYSSSASWRKQRLTVKVKPGHTLNDDEIFNAIEEGNFTVGKRLKIQVNK